jgi:hypothetical protein
MIEDGEARLIRRRETIEDLMRGEEIPARDAGAASTEDKGST